MLPKSGEVLLEACIAQKIESFYIHKVARWCISVAQYSGSRGNALCNKAIPIADHTEKLQKANMKRCRDAITVLLGCCGKQRRVQGGTLRDISRVIAKTIWKTKKDDLWK